MITEAWVFVVSHTPSLESGVERPAVAMEELGRHLLYFASTFGPEQCILACFISNSAFLLAKHPLQCKFRIPFLIKSKESILVPLWENNILRRLKAIHFLEPIVAVYPDCFYDFSLVMQTLMEFIAAWSSEVCRSLKKGQEFSTFTISSIPFALCLFTRSLGIQSARYSKLEIPFIGLLTNLGSGMGVWGVW